MFWVLKCLHHSLCFDVGIFRSILCLWHFLSMPYISVVIFTKETLAEAKPGRCPRCYNYSISIMLKDQRCPSWNKSMELRERDCYLTEDASNGKNGSSLYSNQQGGALIVLLFSNIMRSTFLKTAKGPGFKKKV